jgi:hypothetical protein
VAVGECNVHMMLRRGHSAWSSAIVLSVEYRQGRSRINTVRAGLGASWRLISLDGCTCQRSCTMLHYILDVAQWPGTPEENRRYIPH